jgi:hypothetical protein
VKRPQHPPEPLPRRPPRAARIVVELPAWSCKKGQFTMRLVVRPELLTRVAAAAIESRDGRTTLAGGAIVVTVKRVVSSKGCADHGVRGCRVCTPPQTPAPAPAGRTP